MKKINKLLPSLFVCLVIISQGLISHSSGFGHYESDFYYYLDSQELKGATPSSADYIDGVYSFFEKEADSTLVYASTKADIFHHGGQVKFTYDLGNTAAGYDDIPVKDYKIVVTWQWHGFFSDNANANTYFRVTYTVYYMDGNHPYTLKTVTDTYSSKTWSGSNTFSRTITGNNAVVGQELYIKIQFDMNVHFDWDNMKGAECDFGKENDSPRNYIQLESVEYFHYVDDGQPPGPIR